MSTMHRPKAVGAALVSKIAPWTSVRSAAPARIAGARTWSLTWTIAAPDAARGELVWTIDSAGGARCVLNQQGVAREICPPQRAGVMIIDGLMHVTIGAATSPAGGSPAYLQVVIDAESGVLLYAQTRTLGDLGVRGGRAEPPVLAEIGAHTRGL